MAHDPMSDLVCLYASEAGDFLAQRKRLREARMRWIEENECPTNYSVETKDADGNATTFCTPFQIGKVRYDGGDGSVSWDEGMKKPVVHRDPAAEKELLDGLDSILSEANSSTDKRVTVLVSGDEQHAFFTGSDADVSPYPAIQEGEDYGDYYARVSRSYEREAGPTAPRRPIACGDDLREPSAADSPGIGRSDVPGASPSADVRAMLGSDSDKMRPGDEPAGRPDAGADPRPSDAATS